MTRDDLPTYDECIDKAARVYADWLAEQDPIALQLSRSSAVEPE